MSGNDFEVTDGIDKKRRSGLVGGIYLSLPVAGTPLSVRPELLYAQKGVRGTGMYEYTVGGDALATGTAEFVTKLDYLELPVLLQYHIQNSAGLRPSLYAGPSVAYLVRCRVEANVAGTNESSGCNDGGDGPRKFDVSGVVGGQLGFVLGGQSLGIGVRYTHGFANIVKNVDAKNRTLTVYGAIDFPFSR